MEDEPKITKSGVHPAVILGIIAAVVCVFGYIAFDTRSSTDNGVVGSTSSDTSQPATPTGILSNSPAATQTSSAQDTPQDNSYYTHGSESLCSQGAQELATSYNQSGVQLSSSGLPALSYFVTASHYSASQNSCYIELHNQLPLPQNQGTVDTYTLFVEGGPSGYAVKSLDGGNYVQVSTCSTYPRNQTESGGTQCNYYYPVEKDEVEGNITYTNWDDQYNSKNAPSMSYQDFQSQVQQDMAEN